MVACWILPLLGMLTLAAAGPPPAKPEAPAALLARTLATLRSLPRPDEFELPEPAPALLVALREQLRGSLETSLAAASPLDSAATLSLRLQHAVGGPPEPDDRLGRRPRITAIRPADRSGLLLVRAEYPTRCGSTTSLYVFRSSGGSWRLSWAREPGDQPEQDPGQESLEFQLSEPLPDGSFCLAVCHNPPWCTSCWSSLRITLVRFQANGEYLGTMLDRKAGFYRCDEDNLPHLVHAKGGVILRYQAMSSDPGLWGRQVKLFYAYRGTTARPEPLPGLGPDETLDLWKELEPESAARWSEPSAWTTLQPHHAALRRQPLGSFLFAQPAPGDARRVLVAFASGPGAAKARPIRYFILVLRNGIYRVASASTTRPDGFPGETAVRPER